MGYYSGKDYHIFRADELDLFAILYAYAYFGFQKLYNNRLIKIKIKKDFEQVLNKVLLKQTEIPEILEFHEVEKLRLDFNNKESVFAFYLKSIDSYSISEKDKMYYTIELLF